MTERLTIKRNNGDCVLKAESCCYGWYSFDVQESLRKEGTEIIKKAIYKLAEYETAEEEGRLVVLPCKVGSTVYRVLYTLAFGEIGDKAEKHYFIRKTSFEYGMIDDLNETVFLTRKEAEKVLKEIKKEEK